MNDLSNWLPHEGYELVAGPSYFKEKWFVGAMIDLSDGTIVVCVWNQNGDCDFSAGSDEAITKLSLRHPEPDYEWWFYGPLSGFKKMSEKPSDPSASTLTLIYRRNPETGEMKQARWNGEAWEVCGE